MKYWIGQIIGLVAAATDIFIPQFKEKWQMLAGNLLVNILLGLNLVFLERIGSGIFLFMVAVVQTVVNLVHTLSQTEPKKWELPLFFCLFVGLGFFGLVTAPGFVPQINRQNLLELLPILGAVFSMCFVAAREEYKARKFLLACNLTWATYNGIIGSTSFFGVFFSSISCMIAIWRNRKRKKG